MHQNKPILLYNNQLLFNPVGICHTYGVLVNYCHKKITLHYEIECRFQNYTNNGNYLLFLNRKQVFINDKLPQNKLYEMADEMAKTIYPVILHINKDNKIIDIVNYKEILTRKKSTLQRLSEYFKGDTAQTCLSNFERHCSNPNIIIRALESDLFYKLLFLPLHTLYTTYLTVELTTELSFGENKLPFTTMAKLNPNYSEKEKVVIDVCGVNDNAKFVMQYQLHAEDHTVFSIIGSATYAEKENEEDKMELEIYHLNPEKRMVNRVNSFTNIRKRLSGDKESSIIIEAKEAKPMRKSFWGIFR